MIEFKINPGATLIAALLLQERRNTPARLAAWSGVWAHRTDEAGCGLERKGRRRSLCNVMNFAPIVFGYMKTEYEGNKGCGEVYFLCQH